MNMIHTKFQVNDFLGPEFLFVLYHRDTPHFLITNLHSRTLLTQAGNELPEGFIFQGEKTLC